MKILILGAGGFIGSHLIEHLGARGEHEVLGVDLESEKLEGIAPPNFTFLRADIRELDDSLYDGVDAVVDLIAYANPSIYVDDPLSVYELNFEANIDVVRACIRNNIRLIQYSTSEVYGKSTDASYIEDESDLVMGPVVKHRWIYASAKQLLERVLHAYGLRGDLDYSILRPFNFIGPRLDYLVPPGTYGGPRVFAHFMSALLADGPMFLVDGGHAHRTFLAIEDANTAFQAILDSPEASREIFNVGNPENNTTIRNLAHEMQVIYEDITGRQPRTEVSDVPGEQFYGVGYEDMDRVPPDITKLRNLGWEPRFDLDSALRATIEWYLRTAANEPPAAQGA